MNNIEQESENSKILESKKIEEKISEFLKFGSSEILDEDEHECCSCPEHMKR